MTNRQAKLFYFRQKLIEEFGKPQSIQETTSLKARLFKIEKELKQGGLM